MQSSKQAIVTAIKKICTKCKQELDISMFDVIDSSGKRRQACKKCAIAPVYKTKLTMRIPSPDSIPADVWAQRVAEIKKDFAASR